MILEIIVELENLLELKSSKYLRETDSENVDSVVERTLLGVVKSIGSVEATSSIFGVVEFLELFSLWTGGGLIICIILPDFGSGAASIEGQGLLEGYLLNGESNRGKVGCWQGSKFRC